MTALQRNAFTAGMRTFCQVGNNLNIPYVEMLPSWWLISDQVKLKLRLRAGTIKLSFSVKSILAASFVQAQNIRSLPDDKTSCSSFAARGILHRLQSPLIASFFEVVAGHRVTWGFYDFKGVRAVCINPAVEMRPPQFFMTGMMIISTVQYKISPTNSTAFH